MSASTTLYILGLGILAITPCTAFSIPIPLPSDITTSLLPIPIPIQVQVPLNPELTSTILTASTYAPNSRIQFVILCIFGSGPVLSGWKALPQVRNELSRYTSLPQTPTLSGPALTLNPLQAAFLPSPTSLHAADVLYCIRSCPGEFPRPPIAIPEATCSGSPEELDGWVGREGFVETLLSVGGCNPVAVESLWQALSGGTSTFVSMERVEERIEAYRSQMEGGGGDEDSDGSLRLGSFKQDLGDAKMVKIRGIGTLALLMGVTMSLTLASGLKGFL